MELIRSLGEALLDLVRTGRRDRHHQTLLCRRGQVFGDERLTAALLHRLAHKAHIVEFVGEFYRFRRRMEQEAQQANDR